MSNNKRSKAISIRYTFEKFDELNQMKDDYCEITGRDLTTNKFIKSMTMLGFQYFKRMNDEVWKEVENSTNPENL
jgi:hypothetical protein